MKKIMLFVIMVLIILVVGCQPQSESSSDATSVGVVNQEIENIPPKPEPSSKEAPEIKDKTKIELDKVYFDCPVSFGADEDTGECIKITLKYITIEGTKWYANFLVTNNHNYAHSFTPFSAAIIINGMQYDESRLLEGSTTPVYQGATKNYLMEYSNLPENVNGNVEIILGSMNWGILENPIKMEVSLPK